MEIGNKEEREEEKIVYRARVVTRVRPSPLNGGRNDRGDRGTLRSRELLSLDYNIMM